MNEPHEISLDPMNHEPRPSDRLTIGLWCTAYAGREVFGAERDKAAQFDADPEIGAILAELDVTDPTLEATESWSPEAAKTLRRHDFDLASMAARRVEYQRLDQLTLDLLTGTR